MFKYIFLLISVSWGICSSNVYADITREYEPGVQIALTGSSNGVYFDVHEVVATSSSPGPYLDTVDQKLEGAFYIDGLGWGLLSSGSLITRIHCSENLNELINPCHLTGSGWSENVGEINMSDIVYDPIHGTLSGTLVTFAGTYPIDHITLPLKPVEIETDISNLKTTHVATITVGSGKEAYGTSPIWLFKGTINGTSQFIGSTNAIFSNIDLTLAGDYDFTITDTNGSKTHYSNIEVLPSSPKNTLNASPSYRITTYCSNTPTFCPDGGFLKATHVDVIGSDIVADGSGAYEVTLHMRDTYGNLINTGEIEIYMSGTVDRIIGNLATNDGLVLRDQTFFSDTVQGSWWTNGISLLLDPSPSYRISSLAPTTGTEMVLLKWIRYTDDDGNISILPLNRSLTFVPWVTSNTNIMNPILVNHENSFSVGVTINPSARTDITPQMITSIMIGTGQHAAMRDFMIDSGGYECQAYPQDQSLYTGDCTWNIPPNESLPSIFRRATLDGFSFTGVYASFTAYPQLEPLISRQYISYTGIDNEGSSVPVLYMVGQNHLGMSQFGKSNVKMIGQNNAQGEYGDIITHRGMRAKLFDEIRKTTSILQRNRSSTDTYAGLPYIIYSGNHTLTQSDFDNRQSIIVIGGDITISEDIRNTTHKPLAIIARSDENGNGGMISIAPNVKIIQAGIFSEKSIQSSGNNQLYIFGTLISANTMGDTTAQICPYHHMGACTEGDAKSYDLEYLREGYLSLTPGDRTSHRDNNPTSIKYEDLSLIIEHDMRLISDPPPGIK